MKLRKLINRELSVHGDINIKCEVHRQQCNEKCLINDIPREIVYSCSRKFLCRSQERIYIDKTFESCTNHFLQLQLFTIHVYKNEVYIPVLFSLLKRNVNPPTPTYLSYLKANVQKWSIVLILQI